MKLLYYFLLLTLTINHVYGQLNKTCNGDNECDTSNKFQCINNFCRCQVGYRKVDNNPTCILAVGTDCVKNEDCDNFPGAVCDDYKKCVCEGGFTAGKTECDSIGERGDTCNNHAICIARTNDPNMECKQNECVCKESFHQAGDMLCHRTAGLEDQCSSDNDCHLIVNDQNALECTADHVCKCRKGFTEKNNTCNGSTQLLAFSTTFVGLLIMTLLKL